MEENTFQVRCQFVVWGCPCLEPGYMPHLLVQRVTLVEDETPKSFKESARATKQLIFLSLPRNTRILVQFDCTKSKKKLEIDRTISILLSCSMLLFSPDSADSQPPCALQCI